MGSDLGLPAIQASLYFYADRNAFQQALELDELRAGVGSRRGCDAVGHRRLQRVVLNDANLHWLEWPNRVALLARRKPIRYSEFSRGQPQHVRAVVA